MTTFQAEFSYPSTSRSVGGIVNPFIRSIHDHFERVLQYENESLQSLAKSFIPVTSLQLKAIERMRGVQKAIKLGNADVEEMDLEDAFVIELLNWFKTDFFEWVDCPDCEHCGGPTEHSHAISPSVSGPNHRVEVYDCRTCHRSTEFARYNEAAKLLITRRGRCGEWGNCFTLMCRAMNYDARLVIDNTDHVWTEVFSTRLKRWVHCDPCENAIDTPLMYEAGWGKKLDYIVAYSRDDVQDVTWKYSGRHEEVKSRRNKCTESELINTLMTLRERRWCEVSAHRLAFLKKRLCCELVEMMCNREANDSEKVGRISGSLAWRLERNETSRDPFVWELNEPDDVCIQYQPALDVYQLIGRDKVVRTTIKGWLEGVYGANNVCRKEEKDWKMVYLARKEATDTAEISWKIKIKHSKSIARLRIKVSSTVYHDAKVDWTIVCDAKEIAIPKHKEKDFTLDGLDGLYEFTLTAKLAGGSGKEAWQHSQIFRQEMSNMEDFQLQIYIELK